MITRTTDIAAPAEAVWTILEDVRRLPDVSTSTESVHGAPDRLRAPGQRFRQVVRLLGRTYESDWEVVDIEPGRCLVIEGTVGFGVRYRLTESVVPLAGGSSRLEVRMDYRLPFGPLGRIAARLGVEARAAAEAREVLEGIRRLAEREVPSRSPRT